MTDLASFGETVGILKGASDLARSLVGLHDAVALRGKAVELQAQILSAQSSAIAAQSDQITLLQRVHELEKQIANLEAWDTEKQRYELKEISTGTFAYVVKPVSQGSEPSHWICANCYQHGKKSILQHVGGGLGYNSFTCIECGSKLRTSAPINHNQLSALRIHR